MELSEESEKTFVPISPVCVENGFVYTNSKKIEALADQYETQFSPHPDVFNPKTIDKVNILEIFGYRAAVREIPPTTPAEVIDIIKKNLPNRKAPGHNGIHKTVVKNLPINYVNLISILINANFKIHYFSWKKAIIVLIKKPNSDPALDKNYYPISLLPTLSKLTERIFLKRLITYLPDIPQQFGFRTQHSTTHNFSES